MDVLFEVIIVIFFSLIFLLLHSHHESNEIVKKYNEQQKLHKAKEIEYKKIISTLNTNHENSINSLKQEICQLSDNSILSNQELNDLHSELYQIESQNKQLISKNQLLEKQIDDLNSTVVPENSNLKRTLEEKEIQINRLTYNLHHANSKLKLLESDSSKRAEFLDEFLNSDNITGFPYMASLFADYKTLDIQYEINSLSWGDNKQREKRVLSLTALKKELHDSIQREKELEYNLEYLKTLYPGLEDVLETSYRDIPINSLDSLNNDPIRPYMSSEEYHSLPSSERNQLALDRYIESHKKNKWQIGRDYELYVGYTYNQQGFYVEYFGSLMKLEDLGRDLIAKKHGEIYIIQCKYWGQDKVIHEKHIAQLYGTSISYCLEHKVAQEHIHPVFVTSTILSEQAKRFCDYLKVEYKELFPIGDFPRIKCNVGKDENGNKTYIYHLPMDQQYDNVKLDGDEEFMAFTVQEAEAKGFRRAFRWHGAE